MGNKTGSDVRRREMIFILQAHTHTHAHRWLSWDPKRLGLSWGILIICAFLKYFFFFVISMSLRSHSASALRSVWGQSHTIDPSLAFTNCFKTSSFKVTFILPKQLLKHFFWCFSSGEWDLPGCLTWCSYQRSPGANRDALLGQGKPTLRIRSALHLTPFPSARFIYFFVSKLFMRNNQLEKNGNLCIYNFTHMFWYGSGPGDSEKIQDNDAKFYIKHPPKFQDGK